MEAAAAQVARTGSIARPRTVLAWLEENSLLATLCAVYTTGLLARLPDGVLSDSWMTLLYGRSIWRHGLPHVDRVTTWTHGAHWVDQQWLAQAVFGGAALVGGLKLALFLHAALLVAALVVAVSLARRLGGSARAVPLVTAAALPALIGDWVLRAQSFAYLLFVALVWLLVTDARSPSRRVLLALPLLVLWANLHGSVVLAAALVALRGLTLVRADRRRALPLVVLPWLCVFASPYGFGLVSYYRSLFLNRTLGTLVTEWAPTGPSITTAPFYVLAFGAVALLARGWRTKTSFERILVLVLLANGLVALRNMVWFALAAILVVPPLLDQALRTSDGREPPALVRRLLPLAAALVAIVTACALALRPGSWFERGYPPAAASAVARAAAANPGAPVFADLRYGDWLVWRHPQLSGRLAYDARLELLSRRQLLDVYFWRSHIGRHWDRIAGCRSIVLVNRVEEPGTERALLQLPHVRRVYEDGRTAVLVRRGC